MQCRFTLQADTSNNVVRQVLSNSTVIIVAGNGSNVGGPDGLAGKDYLVGAINKTVRVLPRVLAATSTALSTPGGVSSKDSVGSWYIAGAKEIPRVVFVTLMASGSSQLNLCRLW